MGWRARIAAAKAALAASGKTGRPVDPRVEQIAATSFDDLLAAELRDPEFARHYTLEQSRMAQRKVRDWDQVLKDWGHDPDEIASMTAALRASEHHSYRVEWSPEDGEWIALVPEFPSLSWLDPDPLEALSQIMALVEGVAEDLDEAD